MHKFIAVLIAFFFLTAASGKKPPNKKDAATSGLDQYIAEVSKTVKQTTVVSPGSTYIGSGRLADGLRDLRASQVYDLVYIVVADKASAVSSGVTNTDRKSSLNTSISALAGPTKATGALANLAKMSGETQLQGQGTTSRDSVLTTTLTAEVIYVLPNGNLVVQGQKDIMVNSERQVVSVRGIVRPDDLSPINSIPSDRLARLEVHVNGKGVVEDAVKRPFILYRILLGFLPF
jgi:flagellar L-ring protein precursor FlgH